jgi:archaellum component FlaC
MLFSVRLRPLFLLPLLSAVLFAGPVSCSRSVSNAEILVEEQKRDETRLKVQKLETEIKALRAESAELAKTYGGSDHLQKIKQIDALKADIANLAPLKAEVAEKVNKFTAGAKAHRDYLSSQQP